jgi:TNF receptor-associated factor 2
LPDDERISRSVQSREETEKVLVKMSIELNKLRVQIKSFIEYSKSFQTEATVQIAEIEALGLSATLVDQQLASLKQRYDDQRHGDRRTLRDGYLIWRIGGFREKMADAQSERQTSIYSPAYYTSASGYKVCVRLYLNGDGTARGTYISIFLVLLHGEFDHLLTWPFSYRVSFCLCDQLTALQADGSPPPKHIIESFRPDTKSISFEKPRSDMNIASGIPRFFPLMYFEQPSEINRYVVNNAMFIKVLIDFEGLPRSMLPFVFGLNDGLPAHVRHQMIDVERKRVEQSATAGTVPEQN